MKRLRSGGPVAGKLLRLGFAGLGVFIVAAAPARDRLDRVAPVACPDAPADFVDVADIRPDLSLILSDERTVRMPGLEPPRATAAAPTRPDVLRAKLTEELAGHTIGIAPVGPLDRWGAVPAVVFTEAGPLAERLLREGAVRFRPDSGAHSCRADLLEAEERARNAGASVWADPDLAPVKVGAEDNRLLTETTGMAVVEGTVVSVGETASRIFINIGRGRGGFAISLPKRDNALVGSDIVVRARAIGTSVRVRGLIDRSTSPRIDLFDADALEILTTAGSSAGASAVR